MATTPMDCPLPIHQNVITMAHGGGGKLMQNLIQDVFQKTFDNALLNQMHDAAVFPSPGTQLAFTTDSYVVRPLFFPGGDIGSLAINGTVNDLAMCGAQAQQLSVGFIIEEGTTIDCVQSIATSMAQAASLAGVHIVTGDTKVIGRHDGEGVFINTAGIGSIPEGRHIAAQHICPGDALIISGDVARHGMSVMAAREALEFNPPIQSDCAAIHHAVEALFEAEIAVHCLRDPTRGGLASTCIELAQSAKHINIIIDEPAVPVHADVRGACEILGLDPFYVANEGCFCAFVAAEDAEQALAALKKTEAGRQARIIGYTEQGQGLALCKTAFGTHRTLHLHSGEQLPRIC